MKSTLPWLLDHQVPADKHQLGWLTHSLSSSLLKDKICCWLKMLVTAFSFSSQIRSLLEEDIHCSFKALSQLQIKCPKSHLSFGGFVDVKAPSNFDHPTRVKDHLPIMQGVTELNDQVDSPPSKAGLQLVKLSLLLWPLLRAPACQQPD